MYFLQFFKIIVNTLLSFGVIFAEFNHGLFGFYEFGLQLGGNLVLQSFLSFTLI
jgi:hypothetical protein